MIAHIFVGLAILVISISLIIIGLSPSKESSNLWFGIGITSILTTVFAIFLILWSPLTIVEYNQFEIKYEIQQEMFVAYQENLPEVASNIVYVADIMEINQELAGYQTSKQYWGWWSCIPDRVLELQPVGLER